MITHQPIDAAIIGGGPAGYAAAIYAARSNLTTAVIEQGMSGGQIATTKEVENYPGIPLLSRAWRALSATCRGPGSAGYMEHGDGHRVRC